MSQRDIPALYPDLQLQRPGEPQPRVDELTAKLYEEVQPSIVRILGVQHALSAKPLPDTGKGSGYFYDKDGTVVTDAHVALQNRELFVETTDGKRYRARIDKVDDVNDVATLKLEGFKPGTARPLESSQTNSMTPDQRVWAFGHPLGIKDVYVSPGYFRFNSDMLNALTNVNGKVMMSEEIRAHQNNFTPKELADYRTAMLKPLHHAMVHIQPGNSGGPLVQLTQRADGSYKPEVTGLSRSIIAGAKDGFSNSYFTPVYDVENLVHSKDDKFDVDYAYEAEPWAKRYVHLWKDSPIMATGETALAAGVGVGAVKLAERFPLLRAGVGFIGVKRLADDLPNFLSSTNDRDSMKYGIASASDAAMLAGTVASFIPKVRTIGKVAMALGLTGTVGSEFIPNRLVQTDIRRTDGDMRPPYIAHRAAHLRDFSMVPDHPFR